MRLKAGFEIFYIPELQHFGSKDLLIFLKFLKQMRFGDLLFSILELTEMIATGRPELKNEYTRVVRPGGNPTAMAWIDKVFELGSSDWRGLGNIKNSGFHIRETYEHWDAVKKFSLVPGPEKEIPGCCCAQVICGVLPPSSCTLFGTVCTPENPTGPCMVSGEGACAAAYAYGTK